MPVIARWLLTWIIRFAGKRLLELVLRRHARARDAEAKSATTAAILVRRGGTGAQIEETRKAAQRASDAYERAKAAHAAVAARDPAVIPQKRLTKDDVTAALDAAGL